MCCITIVKNLSEFSRFLLCFGTKNLLVLVGKNQLNVSLCGFDTVLGICGPRFFFFFCFGFVFLVLFFYCTVACQPFVVLLILVVV